MAVTPTPGIALSRTALALEEDPAAGGGTNAHVGMYTIALTADPTTTGRDDCLANIGVASNNADVTTNPDAGTRLRVGVAPARADRAGDRVESPRCPHHRGQETER